MSYRPGFTFNSAGALGLRLLHTGKQQKPHRGGQCEKRDSSSIGVRGIKRTEPRPTAKPHQHHQSLPPLSPPSSQTLISRSKRTNSNPRLEILSHDSVLFSQFSILHHRVFLAFQASHDRDCCRIGTPGRNPGGPPRGRLAPALAFCCLRAFAPGQTPPPP